MSPESNKKKKKNTVNPSITCLCVCMCGCKSRIHPFFLSRITIIWFRFTRFHVRLTHETRCKPHAAHVTFVWLCFGMPVSMTSKLIMCVCCIRTCLAFHSRSWMAMRFGQVIREIYAVCKPFFAMWTFCTAFKHSIAASCTVIVRSYMFRHDMYTAQNHSMCYIYCQ